MNGNPQFIIKSVKSLLKSPQATDMENKRKRIQAAEELPEETIQHIQSFLNAKQGAQTTLVSKSWHTAWLTRPHLYFDQQHFVSDEDDTRFWKFVNNTFQRYEKLNLKIHTLKLWILHAPEEHSLVNKFIITALKMGATDLDFKIYRPNFEFAFPHQVFAFQELSRLSVSGCEIGLGVDDREGGVRCSRLKSLVLESVDTDSHTFWDIISCCPSIENFSWSTRPGWRSFFLGLQHVLEGPGLPNAFHKLKHLSLYVAHFELHYIDDFSTKFPCLEDLAFHNCNLHHVSKISSPSLQRITYTDDKHGVIRLVFDVPRIRKFTFSGTDVPLISFEPTMSTWESDISIERMGLAGGFFLRLRKLLKELSLSKVSLSLKFLSNASWVCTRDFQGVPDKPEVGNLTVKGPLDLDSGFFNYLFQCCRPIYVSHYAFPKKCKAGELKTECKKCTSGVLRKRRKKCTHEEQYDFSKMIQQVSLNSCIAYQRMTAEGKSDLEEVRAELYDESVSEWRLLDTSTALEAASNEHRIRLHLRWGR